MSDYITQDLLFLILKRLPVKTLLRCRCVSKSWQQLISSKSFVLDHLSLQRPLILAQNDNLTYLLFDPQTLPLFHKLKPPIRLKRNDRTFFGLTLSSHHGVNCVYNNAHLLLLFNPSIRRHFTIPLPESPIFRGEGNFYHCGFWIDPSTNDFKVVIFCLETGKCVVFSSKDKSWMEVDVGDSIGGNESIDSPQVMVGGVAHWVTLVEGHLPDIVFFDFAKHEFGTIKLPPKSVSGMICKWQGFLSYVHRDGRRDGIFRHVGELWAMQNGSWIKMFSFQFPFARINQVFCVLERRGRVLASNDTHCLVVYDPKDGFIRLKTRLVEFNRGFFSLSYDFVESLVFPDRNCISSD